MGGIVPRELPAWKVSAAAPVTKPTASVTKLADTKKPRGGRPPKFGKAMTAAERKRLSRAKQAA